MRAKVSPVSTAEEREFERQHIVAQRDRYIATDVLEKMRSDKGYAEKVELIGSAMAGIAGWVLDVGSNTCGEAEVLSTRGHSMIAMDINEVALAVSKERVARFGRVEPAYVAGDAQNIPLQDASVSAAICYDALHHLPEPRQALREIQRVLLPGGRLFFFEPYSYNPYRRLSELRDRLQGTIEKSFGRRELRTLLGATGFEVTSLGSIVLPPSTWKRETVSPMRWILRELYYRAGRVVPQLLGSICGVARKEGATESLADHRPFHQILRCPVSGADLLPVAEGFLSLDPDTRRLYPSHEGIPVLLSSDGVALSPEAWLAMQDEGTGNV